MIQTHKGKKMDKGSRIKSETQSLDGVEEMIEIIYG